MTFYVDISHITFAVMILIRSMTKQQNGPAVRPIKNPHSLISVVAVRMKKPWVLS